LATCAIPPMDFGQQHGGDGGAQRRQRIVAGSNERDRRWMEFRSSQFCRTTWLVRSAFCSAPALASATSTSITVSPGRRTILAFTTQRATPRPVGMSTSRRGVDQFGNTRTWGVAAAECGFVWPVARPLQGTTTWTLNGSRQRQRFFRSTKFAHDALATNKQLLPAPRVEQQPRAASFTVAPASANRW